MESTGRDGRGRSGVYGFGAGGLKLESQPSTDSAGVRRFDLPAAIGHYDDHAEGWTVGLMTDIEIKDVVARIKRAQAETDKFVEEGMKLRAVERKFERERTMLVLTAGAALAGAGAVIGGLIAKLAGPV